MRAYKIMLSFSTLLALTSAAWAGNLNTGLEYNVDLGGTGAPGDAGPFFSSGLPGWLGAESLATHMTTDIQSIPGFDQFMGQVRSTVYYVNGEDAGNGLGFGYEILLDATNRNDLVRASLNPANWSVVDVLDAGSDGSGDSAALAPGWSDGDPYFIERDPALGNPQWQYRVGASGASLLNGTKSAIVWFQTDATAWDLGNIAVQDNGAAVGAAGVLTPLPEPASLALLGLGSLVLFRRR